MLSNETLVVEAFQYSSTQTPKGYVCYDCEARGVKLWRQYQTFADHVQLLCMDCACKAQKLTRYPTEDGKSLYTGELHHWYRTPDMPPDHWWGYDPEKPPTEPSMEFRTERKRHDSIGWLVPAIPTEDGDTFWGYTSVPQAGCAWWHRLPYRITDTG